MSEKVKKPGTKMKVTGYICIGFAALLTMIAVFGWSEEIPATKELIGTWLITGVSLLTVNAGKRIGGQVVMNKSSQ